MKLGDPNLLKELFSGDKLAVSGNIYIKYDDVKNGIYFCNEYGKNIDNRPVELYLIWPLRNEEFTIIDKKNETNIQNKENIIFKVERHGRIYSFKVDAASMNADDVINEIIKNLASISDKYKNTDNCIKTINEITETVDATSREASKACEATKTVAVRILRGKK